MILITSEFLIFFFFLLEQPETNVSLDRFQLEEMPECFVVDTQKFKLNKSPGSSS